MARSETLLKVLPALAILEFKRGDAVKTILTVMNTGSVTAKNVIGSVTVRTSADISWLTVNFPKRDISPGSSVPVSGTKTIISTDPLGTYTQSGSITCDNAPTASIVGDAFKVVEKETTITHTIFIDRWEYKRGETVDIHPRATNTGSVTAKNVMFTHTIRKPDGTVWYSATSDYPIDIHPGETGGWHYKRLVGATDPIGIYTKEGTATCDNAPPATVPKSSAFEVIAAPPEPTTLSVTAYPDKPEYERGTYPLMHVRITNTGSEIAAGVTYRFIVYRPDGLVWKDWGVRAGPDIEPGGTSGLDTNNKLQPTDPLGQYTYSLWAEATNASRVSASGNMFIAIKEPVPPPPPPETTLILTGFPISIEVKRGSIGGVRSTTKNTGAVTARGLRNNITIYRPDGGVWRGYTTLPRDIDPGVSWSHLLSRTVQTTDPLGQYTFSSWSVADNAIKVEISGNAFKVIA